MRRQRVCFIATEWGTSEGGESVLNMRLAQAVAQTADVSCVVLRPSAEKPVGLALRSVAAEGLSSEAIVEAVQSAIESRPDWWIGHDVHTGHIANACRRGLELSCVLNHMDYLSYKPYERDPETLKKSHLQSSIFERADLVIAVGPKLFRTVRDLAPTTRKAQLIPGCENFDPSSRPERFALMLSGRLSEKTDAVKQHRAAVLAFAECVRDRVLGVDPVLTVVGAEAASFDTMVQEASERAQGSCNLVSAGKISANDEYARILTRQSAVVVPSIYEGFSLVGWEALSAAVPVILSKNTGLAEFLASENVPEEAILPIDIKGHLLVESETERRRPNELDVANLKAAYIQMYAECEKRKKAALDARDVLRARYQWSESASAFVDDLASTLADRYYAVEFGVHRETERVAAAALSSKISVVQALSLALKQVARSPLVSMEERVLLAKANLNDVSNETLTRVLEAWTEVPWDFYLSYSSKGDVQGCVQWLSGMTVPVKGRKVYGVTPYGISTVDLTETIGMTLRRTRPGTPVPSVLTGDEEATVAKAVAGLASRLAVLIQAGTAPPPWVLVMDPRLRAAVDADSKKLHWRKEPVR